MTQQSIIILFRHRHCYHPIPTPHHQSSCPRRWWNDVILQILTAHRHRHYYVFFFFLFTSTAVTTLCVAVVDVNEYILIVHNTRERTTSLSSAVVGVEENDEISSEPQGEGASHNNINLPIMMEVFEPTEGRRIYYYRANQSPTHNVPT